MPDPISVVLIAGAVGGASGKFAEKAWDSGAKWVGQYMANHRPNAIQAAQKNSEQFLIELSNRVSELEKSGRVDPIVIEGAQDRPDFSVALHAAMISAAQTDSQDKHVLLASLLGEKLSCDAGDVRSLSATMAVDVVGFLTPQQLKILAFACAIYDAGPISPYTEADRHNWLSGCFSKLSDLDFGSVDLLHLESLSCLRHYTFWSVGFDGAVFGSDELSESEKEFMNTDIAKQAAKIWGKGIESTQLTTVGQLIGVNVIMMITGEEAELKNW